jgi:hypothetical protein
MEDDMNKFDEGVAILDGGEIKEVGEFANASPDLADLQDTDQFSTDTITNPRLQAIYAELDEEEEEGKTEERPDAFPDDLTDEE